VQFAKGFEHMLHSKVDDEEVSFTKFYEIAECVPRIKGQRLLWVQNLNLTGCLARRLKTGEIFDQLSGIRQMSTEELNVAVSLFAEDVGNMLKAECSKLRNSVQTNLKTEAEKAMSKFTGDPAMFGDTIMYQEGLERV
jgi:hypothetical protein